MRLLPLSILPMVLLGGCAGYALDYAKPAMNLVGPQLERYGLDASQSDCVASRLGNSLTVWQLRQLTDLAAVGIREDGEQLTAQDLVWVASKARDPKVTLEVARVVGDCGLVAVETAGPAVDTSSVPQSTPPAAPAPAESAPAAPDSPPGEVPPPQDAGGKIENGPANYQPHADLLAALGAYEREDFTAAARLAASAAEQQDSGAQQFLAGLYAFGRGVPKDFEQAAKYYRLAAEAGWSEAMNNLAKAYETGQGVPQDHVEALKWYLLASLRTTEDEEMVQNNMKNLIRSMSGDQIEQAATLAYDWNREHAR